MQLTDTDISGKGVCGDGVCSIRIWPDRVEGVGICNDAVEEDEAGDAWERVVLAVEADEGAADAVCDEDERPGGVGVEGQEVREEGVEVVDHVDGLVLGWRGAAEKGGALAAAVVD